MRRSDSIVHHTTTMKPYRSTWGYPPGRRTSCWLRQTPAWRGSMHSIDKLLLIMSASCKMSMLRNNMSSSNRWEIAWVSGRVRNMAVWNINTLWAMPTWYWYCCCSYSSVTWPIVSLYSNTDYWLHQWCVHLPPSGLRLRWLHQTRATSCAVQSTNCEYITSHSQHMSRCMHTQTQLRDTHINEQEKAYQLKAQVIEVCNHT